MNVTRAVQCGPQRPLTQLVGVNADARVIVFGLEPGQSVPAHTSSSTVMMQVVEGKGRFQVGDEKRPVGPGDLAICPPNYAHALSADLDGRMVVRAVIAPRP